MKAAYEGGKSANIWDVFSGIPGKIKNGGDTPAIACNFYHLYEDDIRLMKKLGIQSFRFSFSWARIITDGVGKVTPEGISFYKKMIAALKENGIIPNATIYHWDLPYELQVRGGLGNRQIVEWFTHYAEVKITKYQQYRAD